MLVNRILEPTEGIESGRHQMAILEQGDWPRDSSKLHVGLICDYVTAASARESVSTPISSRNDSEVCLVGRMKMKVTTPGTESLAKTLSTVNIAKQLNADRVEDGSSPPTS